MASGPGPLARRFSPSRLDPAPLAGAGLPTGNFRGRRRPRSAARPDATLNWPVGSAAEIIGGRQRATFPEQVVQRKDPGLNQRLDRPDAERLAKVAGDSIGHGGGHAHMERAIGGGFTLQPPRAVTQRRPLNRILDQRRPNAGLTIESGAGPAGTLLRAESSQR